MRTVNFCCFYERQHENLQFSFIRRAVFALLCGVVLVTTSSIQAVAFDQCPSPQFGVTGISVDQTSQTAEDAQIEGMRKAAVAGFSRILSRLLQSPAAVDEFLALNDPDQFVDFFRIAEENSLEGRYIAVLDYCFDAPRLRAAFRETGLPWAELKSPRILVLPVWLAPDGARAWQRDNDWLNGWREAVAEADGLVDFTVLEPTILNERSLRAEDLAAAEPATLRRAATVAGADQIMLVTARLDYQGARQVLAVDGELFTDKATSLTLLARMVDQPVLGDLTTQLALARSQILGELEAGWHSANIIEGSETRQITVEVPVTTLTQWASRLEAFGSIAVIDEYVVRTLDIRGGLVSMTVVGNPAAFANALAAFNLKFTEREGDIPVIEPL